MRIVISLFIFFSTFSLFAQENGDTPKYWHNKERVLHYKPDGNDFVCVNGRMRFNRALYGTNTGFRVEAGDLPEFALYMPGMGGNFKFGLIAGSNSKWLINASVINAIYRPGSMLYEIRDPILGSGSLHISVLALADDEGMIIKTEFLSVTSKAELVWVYGGVSGEKFSRGGDIGADPESSFSLQPDYCKGNSYTLHNNTFDLSYGGGNAVTGQERYEANYLPDSAKTGSLNINLAKHVFGFVPFSSDMHIADAQQQDNPLILYRSGKNGLPVVTGKMMVSNSINYFLIKNSAGIHEENIASLGNIFNDAEAARKKLADRIKLTTPDAWINTLGGTLSMAADAIWENPSYLHGAVAWRMRLNGWRGPYAADPLGWHDRAEKHFTSYALSQIITPPVRGVIADTALHLARQLEQIGTALFSEGYICRNPNGDIRPHHYDMNLVFIDELLEHFNWTGDTAYARKMWPLLQRHLAWEKRNFDADGDGLYDAYAAIWASDALQYSGGGVTYSSAYNYRANKAAAELASLLGEDGTIYMNEAAKILAAVQKNLWLPREGWYAEYKDLLGNQLVHPYPGLWTVYHTIDSKLPDPFQSFQSLRYVDTEIPHIPVKAKGLNEKGLYLLSTTNWQPYTWSLNNVALAENLHTALAYWQGNRNDKAYQLWRSAMIESMYLSASPGGFEQLSYYDAMRGELYRDFADPIGMAARSLVEGLFGVQPDLLHDTLTIQPRFPSLWMYASLQTPDMNIDFKRTGSTDTYTIKQSLKKYVHLQLLLTAARENISLITVNGKKTDWQIMGHHVGKPLLKINTAAANEYDIVVKWKGNVISGQDCRYTAINGKRFSLSIPGVKILGVYDPQQIMNSLLLKDNLLRAVPEAGHAEKTAFLKVKQGLFTWWKPLLLNIKQHMPDPRNRSTALYERGKRPMEKLDISLYFNDKVTNIFKHQYLSPRPASPTLQLPTQGIGNWCYPLTTANIDDSGTRKLAGIANEIRASNGIIFTTPSGTLLNNIVFTSQWNNFPHSATINLWGNASHIYLLMAGSTNPMQSRIINGLVIISYTDGTADTLSLRNPQNWWPVEQDYYTDDFAFTTNWTKPERLYLKQGKFGKGLSSYTSIKGYTNMGIDGGAATVLDMGLDRRKTLLSLKIETVANDVIIGLMAVTLQR
jgi:Domain of unknown function (DUF4450)